MPTETRAKTAQVCVPAILGKIVARTYSNSYLATKNQNVLIPALPWMAAPRPPQFILGNFRLPDPHVGGLPPPISLAKTLIPARNQLRPTNPSGPTLEARPGTATERYNVGALGEGSCNLSSTKSRLFVGRA